MFAAILKVFFGNIFLILGWLIIFVGIFAIFFNTPVGIGMLLVGVLLFSMATVLKRR